MVSKILGEDQPKKEAMLKAARELFIEKSYEETTIADIARRAGVAVGTVYLYFRNKRDVYTAVALDLEARLAQAVLAVMELDLPIDQVLTMIVDNIFRFSHENKELMNLLQTDIYSLEEQEMHRSAEEQITAALATIFERAVARGELVPFDVQMYAQMLNLMGSALLHQCFAVEKGEREAQFHASLSDLLHRLFFGPALRDETTVK